MMKLKLPQLPLILLTLQQSLLIHPILCSSHVVSSTSSRLPMSLSTIINDLEADGASYVATAAFLTSKSVRRLRCDGLLRSLFGFKDDESIEFGKTSAFGKRLSKNNGDEGSGVAVACPSNTATISEVCSTVVACGGTIVYVADVVDLERGEGLFESFAPAVERLLASRSQSDQNQTSNSKHRANTLVVVFSSATDEQEVQRQKKLFEGAAAKMLRTIVQSSLTRATTLENVFDRIEYLSSDQANVEKHLCPAGKTVGHPDSPLSRNPSEVAESVSDVVSLGLVENLSPMVEVSARVPAKRIGPRLSRPVDLAAARLLGPMARNALDDCLTTVRRSVGEDWSILVPEFGALIDAAIIRALNSYDATADGPLLKSSVAKRLRNDLRENLYTEMGDIYEVQVSSLKAASFDSFKSRLNKLRITPNLSNEMSEAAKIVLKDFATGAKKLRASNSNLPSVCRWTSLSDQISDMRNKLSEYNSDRLRAARASGQYKPPPRKGVTLGFHWMLPKPFGNDYRQEPWMMGEELVYIPEDGITDVTREDVRTGDWRKGVVPALSGSEMLYMK